MLLISVALYSGDAFTLMTNKRSLHRLSSSSIASTSIPQQDDPAIQAAMAEVREAAASFSKETAAFADEWLNSKLWDGKHTAVGLLDECLIDWDAENPAEKCERFENALMKLDEIIGSPKEQF
jgi:hypothetical protein